MSMFGTIVEIAGESALFFGIGFLLAALLAVACIPAVHNRASRLTTRRLESVLPDSIKDVQIEKDHLRAEFAVSTRRLETSVEELRAKTCAQVEALVQKSETINKFKAELDQQAEKINALEERESTFHAREKSLCEQLRTSNDDLSRMKGEIARISGALQAAEYRIAAMRSDRHKFGSVIAEFSRLVGHKRNEIHALRTEVDTIRNQANEIAYSVKEVKNRSDREQADAKNATMTGRLN